jgi:hypothetical protein
VCVIDTPLSPFHTPPTNLSRGVGPSFPSSGLHSWAQSTRYSGCNAASSPRCSARLHTRGGLEACQVPTQYLVWQEELGGGVPASSANGCCALTRAPARLGLWYQLIPAGGVNDTKEGPAQGGHCGRYLLEVDRSGCQSKHNKHRMWRVTVETVQRPSTSNQSFHTHMYTATFTCNRPTGVCCTGA